MVRKLVVPLFIVALAAHSTEIRAAARQSLDFLADAPSGAAAGTDDLRIGIKATGVPNINSGAIDLLFPELAEVVTRKAGKAACVAAFQKNGATCLRTAPVFACVNGTNPGTDCTFNPNACLGGGTCPTTTCVGTACCNAFDVNQTVNFQCRGTGGNGFELGRAVQEMKLTIGAIPPGGVASITNVNADNNSVYTQLGFDIATRSLFQLRPNGVTGTIRLRFFHQQGGTNPLDLNFVVDSSNNDPGEGQVLAAGLKTGIESVPLPTTRMQVIVHTADQATPPLTWSSGFFKLGTHFIEITNNDAAKITEVQTLVIAGQGLTVESTENAFDAGTVPTLSTWGIVVLVIMLLLSGYVLMRRQRVGAATT